MCWQSLSSPSTQSHFTAESFNDFHKFRRFQVKANMNPFSCLFCLPNRLVYRHQSPMHVCYIRESSRIDSMPAHKVFHRKVSSTAWENCLPTHTQGVARHAEGEENDVNNSAMKSSRRGRRSDGKISRTKDETVNIFIGSRKFIFKVVDSAAAAGTGR